MCFACWITKATDALRIRNTYFFFTATVVSRTRLNVTSHVYCLSFSLSSSCSVVVCSLYRMLTVPRVTCLHNLTFQVPDGQCKVPFGGTYNKVADFISSRYKNLFRKQSLSRMTCITHCHVEKESTRLKETRLQLMHSVTVTLPRRSFLP
jgi:hypothetical protein